MSPTVNVVQMACLRARERFSSAAAAAAAAVIGMLSFSNFLLVASDCAAIYSNYIPIDHLIELIADRNLLSLINFHKHRHTIRFDSIANVIPHNSHKWFSLFHQTRILRIGFSIFTVTGIQFPYEVHILRCVWPTHVSIPRNVQQKQCTTRIVIIVFSFIRHHVNSFSSCFVPSTPLLSFHLQHTLTLAHTYASSS